MKSVLKAFGLAALAGAIVLPAQAGDDKKDLKKVIEDQGINYVETAQKGITLSGYVDTSYTYQFASKGQYGNTSAQPSSEAVGRQFDTDNNDFNINAVKIALEKALPDKNEWAAGFRIDAMYGEDAKILGATDPATGDGTSGVYLEQALVKFRVPVGNGLDFYAGKFVTFLGYEVIESPANLNFSRGLLFTNAIPLTHTGVYADYKFNDTFEAKFGIVDGWNSSDSPTVAATASNSNFGNIGKAITGQLNITAPGKNANICQSFIYSPEGEPGTYANPSGLPGTQDGGPLVVYDIWGNWNPTFVKDNALLLGFNIDLGYNGASGRTDAAPAFVYRPSDSNTWWGIALYSKYQFNKVFSLAGRLEYLHEDSARFPHYAFTGATANTGATGFNGQYPAENDWSATLTASFNIWDNLLTRVEYRFDQFNPGTADGVHSANQNEISVNAVYSF